MHLRFLAEFVDALVAVAAVVHGLGGVCGRRGSGGGVAAGGFVPAPSSPSAKRMPRSWSGVEPIYAVPSRLIATG